VLLLVALVMLRALSPRLWPLVALAAVPFVWPGFLDAGAWNLSLLIFAALLAALLWKVPRARPEMGVLWLWLLVYFIVYAGIIRSAGLHFYTLMPALMLLAAHVLPEGGGAIRARVAERPLTYGMFALLLCFGC